MMTHRRPIAARATSALPALATLIAGAALSTGCQSAEARTRTEPSATAPESSTSQPTEPPTDLVQAQQAVPGLVDTAMTVPRPPPPPEPERTFYGGAMAMVRPYPIRRPSRAVSR